MTSCCTSKLLSRTESCDRHFYCMRQAFPQAPNVSLELTAIGLCLSREMDEQLRIQEHFCLCAIVSRNLKCLNSGPEPYPSSLSMFLFRWNFLTPNDEPLGWQRLKHSRVEWIRFCLWRALLKGAPLLISFSRTDWSSADLNGLLKGKVFICAVL